MSSYPWDECVQAPGRCLEDCRRGRGGACYGLALAVQDVEVAPETSQALFYRACAAGEASGCTNFAAGSPEDWSECQLATYEAACKARDPWACAMLGTAMAKGLGRPAAPDEARRVLARACLDGEDDPACEAARFWLDWLDEQDVRPDAGQDTDSPPRAEGASDPAR